jgi:hypothetical protein
LSACLQLLRLYRVPHWRQNAGGIHRQTADGRRRYYRFCSASGVSDIIGLLLPTGRVLAVECKRRGGVLTAPQRQFLAAVNAAGGLGVVIDDVKALEAILRAEGVIR